MLKPAGGGGAGGGGGGICECGSNSPPLDEDADEDEDEADDPLPVAAVAEDDEEAAEDPWPPTAEAEEDAAADEPPRGLELVLVVLGAAAENDKAATSRSHARCICARKRDVRAFNERADGNAARADGAVYRSAGNAGLTPVGPR